MQEAPSETRYHLVQGLARGLEVLCAMNQLPGGGGTILEISRKASLHRTTTKRLLETLRACGFVRQTPGSKQYHLTFRTRRLSDGFRDEEWISQIAVPYARQLTNEIQWPSDILTLDGDELMVRESTHPFSPLSFHRSMIGEHLPLLATAAGRAYLAFCPDGEREALLDVLRSRGDAEGQRARDAAQVRHVLETTRRLGYGVNHGEWLGGGERFGGIAVPIFGRSHVLACLNVIFSLRVISPERAAERYLAALTRTAQSIAAAMPG